MKQRLPLQGIRVHLSGSIHDDATRDQSDGIALFAKRFARAVLREGGTLIHGSHPTFNQPLQDAARPFVSASGSRDALTLVRAQKFAITGEQLAEIEAQRQYCTVQIVPAIFGKPNQSLLPMREWMAEHCDVVVAIGGNHWHVSKERAGVPEELEEALCRGKPGFMVGGFGGATGGYIQDHDAVFSRLRNGLPISENRAMAETTDVEYLVNRIISQIQLLPLVRESVQGGRLFRILALDGGGLRGTFTAAVLAKWDDMIKSGGGNELVKHFDLVAGTSTGAILAVGLGFGLAPLEILDFYRTYGPNICGCRRRRFR